MKQRELEQILNTHLKQFEDIKIRVIALERAMEGILSKNP